MFNKLYFKLFLLFLCLTCSQVWAQQSRETSYLKAKKGILDLSKVDPEILLKNYPLEGEWKFYPGQRLEALDPKKIDKAGPFAYVNVPGSWKDLPENTKELREFKKGLPGGIGTYQLTLILPVGHNPFFLEGKDIDYSLELWINGVLQRRSGEVDLSKFRPHQILRGSGAKSIKIVKAQGLNKENGKGMEYKVQYIVSNKKELDWIYKDPGIKKKIFLTNGLNTSMPSTNLSHYIRFFYLALLLIFLFIYSYHQIYIFFFALASIGMSLTNVFDDTGLYFIKYSALCTHLATSMVQIGFIFGIGNLTKRAMPRWFICSILIGVIGIPFFYPTKINFLFILIFILGSFMFFNYKLGFNTYIFKLKSVLMVYGLSAIAFTMFLTLIFSFNAEKYFSLLGLNIPFIFQFFINENIFLIGLILATIWKQEANDAQQVHQNLLESEKKLDDLDKEINQKVEEIKSASLARSTEVKKVIDLIPDSIISFGPKLFIDPTYSDYAKTMFPKIQTGLPIHYLLGENLKCAADAFNDEKESWSKLPKELELNQKFYELRWSTLRLDNKSITHLVLCISDVTKDREEMAKKAKEDAQALEKLEEAIKKSAENAKTAKKSPFYQKINEALKTDTENLLTNVKMALEDLNYSTLENILADQVNSLAEIATKLEKKTPNVKFITNHAFIHVDLMQTLKDVCVYCLRNSMDHGIELPSERLSKGKPEQGTIFLELSKDNHLRIYDDGRGLNLKALRKKMTMENPTDQQVAESIFDSGMSTAEKVTDISGRGVGMDAVRSFIQEKGGGIIIEFMGDDSFGGEMLDFRPFCLNLSLPIGKIKYST